MPGDITTLLRRWQDGDLAAGQEVITRTYPELRRIARRHHRGERAGHTLQTTALLHEAYLRLLRGGPGPVDNREAFFRLMSAEMKRRLIDHARRRLAGKRGAGAALQVLRGTEAVAAAPAFDVETLLERLDSALERLGGEHPRAAQTVQLRFIAGMSVEEAAECLGLSPGTVKRDWAFARAWLAAALGDP